MSKLILVTSVLIISFLAYLLGYYSHLAIDDKGTQNLIKKTYTLPLSPDQTGVTSTNVTYSIEGVLYSISNDKSSLTIQTNDKKILGPYKVDPQAIIQQRIQNKLNKVNKDLLQSGENIKIVYVFNWTYYAKGSYISSVLIK
jgi:hypothetical protein